MSYVDFAELKERVTIDQVADLLGLQMKPFGKQLRGPCPACNEGGDRALVITPERGAFYCFADKQGGDLIALAAHIRGEAMKEAAGFIHHSLTVPEEKAAQQNGATATKLHKKLQPLSHLEYDHPALTAQGIDPAIAEGLGIGWATKGIARGNIVIPVRDGEGSLIGYIGCQEMTFVPDDFQTNVVPINRKTA